MRTESGMRSVRNCIRDEGRPFGAGFQDQASNRLQAAVVKSHGGERWRKRSLTRRDQVSFRETNASEPLMMCRNPLR